ncbi:hypothetical protein EYF80_001640 [Liparis tanakae]|uniref:Uncharacterized protein n=1 Tax=Liparis tanakae TaxID=230148 RepID=A0A4Z2JCW9_9TELE|nr:hypothetical protein EYF80_001640 [Liparis tanakae]
MAMFMSHTLDGTKSAGYASLSAGWRVRGDGGGGKGGSSTAMLRGLSSHPSPRPPPWQESAGGLRLTVLRADLNEVFEREEDNAGVFFQPVVVRKTVVTGLLACLVDHRGELLWVATGQGRGSAATRRATLRPTVAHIGTLLMV